MALSYYRNDNGTECNVRPWSFATGSSRASWLPVRTGYRTAGYSLKGHPITFVREQLDRQRIVRAGDLKSIRDGRYIRVAGVVLIRQRPGTARGITFILIEDETGTANLVVRPAIWDRYYAVARGGAAWIAHGVLGSHESVIHLLVNGLEDLSARLGKLRMTSRDFR